MANWNISEKTAAILPDLIKQAGITNPIFHVEETKTLVRFYLVGHNQPVTVRKPKPSRSSDQQTRGKKEA